MDKAAIRAKALRLYKDITVCSTHSVPKELIEAALTQVHNEGRREGFKEAIEAAVVTVNDPATLTDHRHYKVNLLKCELCTILVEAIRRLRIDTSKEGE